MLHNALYTEFEMFLIIFLVVILVRWLVCIHFNHTHQFHSPKWLLQNANLFLKLSKSPDKMKKIIQQLYRVNFKYLSYALSNVLLLPQIIQPNEIILKAVCGCEFQQYDAHRGAKDSPILVITNQRIFYIDCKNWYRPVRIFNPNQILSIIYKKSIPLLRRPTLVIKFKNKILLRYNALYLQFVSEQDCQVIKQIVNQRKS